MDALSLPQITSNVLMIAPRDFGFNEEAAADNEFQTRVENKTNEVIRTEALKEFFGAVELLRSKGVNVVVFDKNGVKALEKDFTPDSVFPNNWLGTDSNGNCFVFPMLVDNRRKETNAYPFIHEQLKNSGFNVKKTIYLDERLERLENSEVFSNPTNQALEGTGSIIFDKIAREAYASLSQRTEKEIADRFLKSIGYEPVIFESESLSKKPFYHTNIILSIGDKFAIASFDGIKAESREAVREALKQTGREIIEISLEQTEKFYCGNVLQVSAAASDNKFIVMSSRGFSGFTEEQKKILSKYGELVALNIDTIETIGGGSARCMICELFLNKN